MQDLQYRLLHALVDEVCDQIYHGVEPSENTVEVLKAAFSTESYPKDADLSAIAALRLYSGYKTKLDELLS
jgi:hypothetical protein